MSNKFTEGPWRYALNPEDCQKRELGESKRSGDIYFVAPVAYGNDICEVHRTYPNTAGVTSEANARLIAASPDMYHVLTAIIRDLPTNRDWLDPDLENTARALLVEVQP